MLRCRILALHWCVCVSASPPGLFAQRLSLQLLELRKARSVCNGMLPKRSAQARCQSRLDVPLRPRAHELGKRNRHALCSVKHPTGARQRSSPCSVNPFANLRRFHYLRGVDLKSGVQPARVDAFYKRGKRSLEPRTSDRPVEHEVSHAVRTSCLHPIAESLRKRSHVPKTSMEFFRLLHPTRFLNVGSHFHQCTVNNRFQLPMFHCKVADGLPPTAIGSVLGDERTHAVHDRNVKAVHHLFVPDLPRNNVCRHRQAHVYRNSKQVHAAQWAERVVYKLLQVRRLCKGVIRVFVHFKSPKQSTHVAAQILKSVTQHIAERRHLK